MEGLNNDFISNLNIFHIFHPNWAVGASLYNGRTLIYNAAISQHLPVCCNGPPAFSGCILTGSAAVSYQNWTSKKRGKIGGLTESEFHSKVENGDRLTWATCTFRRIAKVYKKMSGFNDLRDTLLSVKWTVYGASHILEVENSPFMGRRKEGGREYFASAWDASSNLTAD